ncbi:unnamed protein product [Nezara viridula]|uniref:Uncharacterized protein n=1 Tax=Nezara viridula TaxID=85310 RepID=A0A9P0HMM6_NEZVI|nr:unnamed protein product [Nezara viridula]
MIRHFESTQQRCSAARIQPLRSQEGGGALSPPAWGSLPASLRGQQQRR